MTTPQENLYGHKGKSIEYSMPMTCFTEIKLSDTHKHTERYGCLGFGFSREFVIKRSGGPVLYVPETEDDAIVANFSVLWDFLKQLRWMANARLADGRTLCDEDKLGELINAIGINIGFTKNMSECKSPRDFQYLDEAEWRIISTVRRVEERKINWFGLENTPPAKIPFKPCDLKVLILPDNKTRQQVLSNKNILEWFGEPPNLPIIATVDECLHF